MHKGYIIFIIFFILRSSALISQGGESETLTVDTFALKEISILVLPFEEKYKEATGSIFLLGNKDISQSFGINTSDLYNEAPSVYMASGALNTNRIVIRGVGSRTLYNTNRIKAYLDDIPLTSGDGFSTLEDQDPMALSSIEILKGPASALYGAGLGGGMRLNSPTPSEKRLSIDVFAETSSYLTHKYGTRVSYMNSKLALTTGFARSTSDGYRENSKYERNNAFVHARYKMNRHTLMMTLSLVNLYSEIPSSLNEDDYLNNPQKAGGDWGNIGGYEEYNRILSGLKLESMLSRRIKTTLYFLQRLVIPTSAVRLMYLMKGQKTLG